MTMMTMMEGPSWSQKSFKFPFRRVHDSGLLGCFMAPLLKCQALTSPDISRSPSSSSSSSKDDFFSSDDPDVDPLFTTPNSTSKPTKPHTDSNQSLESFVTEETFVFSPPNPPFDAVVDFPSFRTLSDPLMSTLSYNHVPVDTDSDLRGRPQRLPAPVKTSKPVWLPLPAPRDYTGVDSPSSELRFMSGANSSVSTSSSSSSSAAVARRGGVGSWSIRRGKAAPVGGMPLPPPSVATKLLPGLEAFEFEDLVQGTRQFAPECCMEKGEFGAVYRAWVKSESAGRALGRQLAVVRLNVNENQTLKDWKSDVQMLAQLPDSNICLLKGYSTHEDEDSRSVSISSERLLVFEQSPNGTLHDYLCGSRSKTQLDWSARVSIVLGAARGLMYLHDRAPLQIVYREFKASTVLLDKDYTPRLAGYGLSVTSSSADRKSSLSSVMKTSQAHAKTNVYRFGIVLIELLTGKHSLDTTFLCNEKSFIRWATPFLKDSSKLPQILDPRMKSKCPLQGASRLAELALQCLKRKPLQRPAMSRVVETLKSIKEDFGGRGLSSRRATLGGVPLSGFEEQSNTLDRPFLSVDCRLSVSTSSGSDESDSGRSSFVAVAPLQCTRALQPARKGVENATKGSSSCRVF